MPAFRDCDIRVQAVDSAKSDKVVDISGQCRQSAMWHCGSVGGCSDSGEASTEGCTSDGGSEDSVVDLQAEEDRLRRRVPQLLESMNRASEEVNALERQVHAAQARYHLNVGECDSFYNELRRRNGPTFDRVKAYLSAVQEVKAASHRLQTMARNFSAAGVEISRLEAAGATQDEVAPCRHLREKHEQEYVRALNEHRSAQGMLDTLRAQIGDSAIQGTLPAFQQLQQHQLKLVVEHSRMHTLVERAGISKHTYQSSMRELERISSAVHDIRRLHAQQTARA